MTRESPIHVVAGVLRDASGRVLVARRPDGAHLGGLWEFPGGKSEPGESPLAALRRELSEELGIEIAGAEPLIRVPHAYPEKTIELDAWVVDAWSGSPHAREHEALRWIDVESLPGLPMPPADRPVVAALRLPDVYLITPPFEPSGRDELLRGIARAASSGIRLIQFRQAWTGSVLAETAEAALAICRRAGARLLVNADIELAVSIGADGVHLPARIAAALRSRPISDDLWLAASCHDEHELAAARRIGADFATVSPVAPTPSHPDAKPLGWPRFAELTRKAAMPAYALGGVARSDLARARASGARGIAAIRALWPQHP